MTDTNTNEAPATTEATTAESKAKTVLENMDSRRVFNTTEEAGSYIAKCMEDFADFGNYEVVFAGCIRDDDGNADFNPEVYTDEMAIAICKLTEKGNAKEGKESTVKAICIYPTPKLEYLLQSESGKQWVESIVEKEANLVAMRQPRKAADKDELHDAEEAMPTTPEDYWTSGRDTASSAVATYNEIWKRIKAAIGKKVKAFGNANLSKKELRRGMESSSYAAATYPILENRTNKAGQPESAFVGAATYGMLLAKKEGLDPSLFEKMLATRNEREIEVNEDEDDLLDFEAMAAEIETAPAGEVTTEEVPEDAPAE